jgi:hypothetical protein
VAIFFPIRQLAQALPNRRRGLDFGGHAAIVGPRADLPESGVPSFPPFRPLEAVERPLRRVRLGFAGRLAPARPQLRQLLLPFRWSGYRRGGSCGWYDLRAKTGQLLARVWFPGGAVLISLRPPIDHDTILSRALSVVSL